MADPAVSFRCPCDVRDALQRARRVATRSLAHQLEHYVRRGLIADGFLPDPRDNKPRLPTDAA